VVAYCPERVLPGRILIEMKENNRIVGGLTKSSAAYVRDLYGSFVTGEIFLTDATTAEMTKLMENTYRDVNIALANELAKICERMGINAWDVISMANRHPRVHLHQPGPGVGGHCIAVDPWFIVEKQPELAGIIALARLTNDGMPEHVCEKVRGLLPEAGGKVCVLGVTYKPDVDDMRESPIVELIRDLRRMPGVEVTVSDPHVDFEGSNRRSIEEAATGADLIVLAVNHSEFKSPDFGRLSACMRHAVVLDTRNFWKSESLEAKGFSYHLLGMGRKLL
jgi:UDP-N-acetyl-D-mannosaminuronic acid dehydrogenase